MGVAVSGDTVYVADGDGGVRVLDVSDPATPQEVGVYRTGGPAMAIAVVDNTLYVADFMQGLLVLDVWDRIAPPGSGDVEDSGACPASGSTR